MLLCTVLLELKLHVSSILDEFLVSACSDPNAPGGTPVMQRPIVVCLMKTTLLKCFRMKICQLSFRHLTVNLSFIEAF